MILYHWTLNDKKIKESGFRDHHSRHKDEKDGIWFTDKLMGGPDDIRPGIRLVTIDVPNPYILPYEETNKDSGYRVFSIPADIVNQFTLNFPTVYSDRGIYKINGG